MEPIEQLSQILTFPIFRRYFLRDYWLVFWDFMGKIVGPIQSVDYLIKRVNDYEIKESSQYPKE